MEFFEFYSALQYVVDAFLPGTGIFGERVQELVQMLWISIIVGVAVYLAALILGGVGLTAMAKREGKKHKWMAFFPLLNTWYAGYITGDANFFGQKMKRAGLYAAIVEGLYITINVISVCSAFVLLRYPLEATELDPLTGATVPVITVNLDLVPGELKWLFEYDLWFSVGSFILNILLIVFFFVIFFALFRKYYARNPMLMTFLCGVLPFRGFVLFAVRNNKPVDYDEYMRQRFEEMRRQQYGPHGPYGSGPYNGQGYGGQPQQGHSEPFSDFGGKPQDPFSDFGENGAAPPPPNDEPFSDFH